MFPLSYYHLEICISVWPRSGCNFFFLNVTGCFLEIISHWSNVFWSGKLDLMSSTWGNTFCVNIICVGHVTMVQVVKKGHFSAVTHLHLKKCHFCYWYHTEVATALLNLVTSCHNLFCLLSGTFYSLKIDLKTAQQWQFL